ncbi:MAG: hypothetical protein AB7P17_06515 [Nitrospirales bacterium]
MNTNQSEPKSNVFCLTGILASLLLITSLLTEGKAHTIPIPVPPSTLTQPYNKTEYSPSKLSETIKKPKEFKNAKKDGPREWLPEDFDKNGQPKKKRMGLALIFLGILAEEG